MKGKLQAVGRDRLSSTAVSNEPTSGDAKSTSMWRLWATDLRFGNYANLGEQQEPFCTKLSHYTICYCPLDDKVQFNNIAQQQINRVCFWGYGCSQLYEPYISARTRENGSPGSIQLSSCF
ncbi:hypothetical protein E1B28_004991 [Marasmius oreades]|uniref:Uncharacterized protein n=1 Tax=Marasmius oreades TaxID=181124 RepID=A0A9P8ADN7_9AGAR|nr:uncharacterized protein E1B28_004991 [Marasmius oreades]KAG7097663.1 hypothetical protein E1B28_004991 [Marasmius oreades]